MSSTDVFAAYHKQAWPFTYKGTLLVDRIAGGTPTDPKVAEGWIRRHMGEQSDQAIREMVATTMLERGVSPEAAVEEVNTNRHLLGFKRDDRGLYLEGRCLKSAIKEACNVCVAAGKLKSRGWGATNKGSTGFIAEHVMVVDNKLHFDRTEATGIEQRFVHVHTGNGIRYDEYCDNVELHFTVVTDFLITDEQWALIWLTGAKQGIGGTRSQGYGTYTVTKWDKV